MTTRVSPKPSDELQADLDELHVLRIGPSDEL